MVVDFEDRLVTRTGIINSSGTGYYIQSCWKLEHVSFVRMRIGNIEYSNLVSNLLTSDRSTMKLLTRSHSKLINPNTAGTFRKFRFP